MSNAAFENTKKNCYILYTGSEVFKMGIYINKNSIITGVSTTAINHAVNNLKRDIEKKFNETQDTGAEICLENASDIYMEEQFKIVADNDRVVIKAADELGFIYGIYEVSKRFLGIKEFWFWNDQVIEPVDKIIVDDNYYYESVPCRVRYRGWFINDEVLISRWTVGKKKDKPWEMVFEALLRLHGNMVIPGTDNNSKRYSSMAADMGLRITHHHAEPLGAEMFLREFPELKPSYKEHGDKFRKLWQEAIDRQKNHGVIWNLGFRGQGDYPFWENDPEYNTDESRGRLISDLIRVQYDMLKKAEPEAQCCTNLYGETMDLYNKGYLSIQDDVIKIWADNGYGKMVSRRQGNNNPRVYSLPNNHNGRHGIYYHVSFYDLQAANHITMLQNPPELIKKELQAALQSGADDYWIINCSNVKPHVYYLDFIADMWKTGDIDIEQHRHRYVSEYYPGEAHESGKCIEMCFQKYSEYAVQYGKNEDDHAGEQFTNHVARMLISQYMKDKTKAADDLEWTGVKQSLLNQTEWYHKLCITGKDNYKQYVFLCEKAICAMKEDNRRLFRDSVMLQAQIYLHCYQGAYYVTEALKYAFDKKYQEAFYCAGKARKEYLNADNAMRDREHGKWKGFYQNECLTDVKQTAWVLEGLMAYIRNLGDGPHYYEWQREYMYAKEDRSVMLILNMENHLKDLELYELMEKEKEK